MAKPRLLRLADLVAWGKGTTLLSDRALAVPVRHIWMDSRKIEAGDVFVALSGEANDGHDYVDRAFEAGAVASIVARREVPRFGRATRQKLVAVGDPLVAIQRMAASYRRELAVPVVAVTGSNGKTSTRQAIATVLRSAMPVSETYTNWNNHIGVPLSLLRFTGSERAGVIEIAANHEGEIAPLSRIARPDIALITNIGYAHVGNFGSLANTTRAKFEITAGLRRGSALLLNGDDSRLVHAGRASGFRVVLFGTSAGCQVRATDVTANASGCPRFRVDGRRYALPVRGRHFVYCALPAIWLGRHFGMSPSEIAHALRSFGPGPMRGGVKRKRGVVFVMDCYNANPSSMNSGLLLLQDIAGGRRAVAIVGDMLELGRYSRRLHRELGQRLGRAGLSKVVAVGQFADNVADGARKAGMPASSVRTVASAPEAAVLARALLKTGDTVLLKGSRGVKLETVFEEF